MKKIINPWLGVEGYFCFGCAPDNEAGVKMEFYEDGNEIVSIWKPEQKYQSWLNMKFVVGWSVGNCRPQGSHRRWRPAT